MRTGYNIREGSRMIAERIALLGEGEAASASGAQRSPSPSGPVPQVAAPIGSVPSPPARSLRVADHGPAGVRRLRDGERVINGRVLYCEAWGTVA